MSDEQSNQTCKYHGCTNPIDDMYDDCIRLESCYHHMYGTDCSQCKKYFLSRGRRRMCYECNPYHNECCYCGKTHRYGSVAMPLDGMDVCLRCGHCAHQEMWLHKMLVLYDFSRYINTTSVKCLQILQQLPEDGVRLKIIKMIEENLRQSERSE
jgi:hypothetical protein